MASAGPEWDPDPGMATSGMVMRRGPTGAMVRGKLAPFSLGLSDGAARSSRGPPNGQQRPYCRGQCACMVWTLPASSSNLSERPSPSASKDVGFTREDERPHVPGTICWKNRSTTTVQALVDPRAEARLVNGNPSKF